MNDLKYNVLTAQELKECTDIILQARPIILKWSEKIYGEVKFRHFRKDYFAGKLETYKIPKAERAKLEKIQSIEVLLLQHNHRICTKLANKYFTNNKHKMKGVTLEDFQQEAYMGVIYATYSWSGETKFITYVHHLISNNLKAFVRIEHPLSPPSPFIQDYGIAVKNLMSKTGVNFDQALVELKIPKDQNMNVMRVISDVYSQYDEKISLSNVAVGDENIEFEDYSLMKAALETCQLTEIERAAFNQYMNGKKIDLTKRFKVTRQAIHVALQRAKSKIRKRYIEIAPGEVEFISKNIA